MTGMLHAGSGQATAADKGEKGVKSILAMLALVAVSPATAQTVTATKPETVAGALRDAGFRAEMTKDDTGDPLIKSGASGIDFRLSFYNCTANKDCSTVQFYAGFKKSGITLDKINNWNATHRFARAYLDDEKEPRIEMDVDLDEGGMSPALFKANIATWESLLGEFLKAIDF